MFDLRLISSFLAVAQWKHFGKAAAAMHTTQPGISQHIARLEDQLGFQLVARTKRTVALTPAGVEFAVRAKQLLTMVERMKEDGKQISNGMLGRLTIGLSSSILYSDIPKRITAFKAAHPNIDVRIFVHGGEYLKERMNNGELDAMITVMSMPSPEYTSIIVSRQKMGVAVPTSHPLAKRRHVTLKQLLNDSFIVVPREYDPQLHDSLLARFRALGATIRIAAYETPSLNALARVALGEGVSLLGMSYRNENRDVLDVIPLRDPELGTTLIYATFHRDVIKPAAARLMKALSISQPV